MFFIVVYTLALFVKKHSINFGKKGLVLVMNTFDELLMSRLPRLRGRVIQLQRILHLNNNLHEYETEQFFQYIHEHPDLLWTFHQYTADKLRIEFVDDTMRALEIGPYRRPSKVDKTLLQAFRSRILAQAA